MYEFMYHYPAFLYLIALLAVLYFLYNLRKLFVANIGKSDPQDAVNILDAIVNGMTLGIFQRKVTSRQFGFAGLMHFFLWWGFVILLIATTIDFFVARHWFVDLLPTLDTPWFASLYDAGGLMVLIGLVMAIYRRKIIKPGHLPHDCFEGRGNFLGDSGILLLLLVLVVGGFLAEAARLGTYSPPDAQFSWIGYSISKLASQSAWQALELPLWWFHAITSFLFIALLPQTKMLHAIAGFINVLISDRKTRGQIRPMYVSKMMEDPDADIENIALGVSKVEDFRKKQLFDSIACTECARCTYVCPAYNTDKPLSPMKVITDIRHNLYAQQFGIGEKQELIGQTISELELWSCTTCGACMEQCPVQVEHVPTIVDMRRHLVLSEGKPPEQASESLEKTMTTGNPWGLPRADRMKWANDAGLEVPLFSQKKKADVLYWVGCAGAYDPLNQPVAVAMIKILEAAGVDYAVLGTEESCTGDSARRLGEEYLFETMAVQNIETLSKYEFKTIITPCPHCFHTISKEYPAFKGNYKVKHHSEYIAELIEQGLIKPDNSLQGKITYHDACYLGRHNDIYNQPRDLIFNSMSTGSEYIELERNRKNSFCCGAGGGNMWHDIEEGSRPNVNRIDEASAAGVDTVVTACSFCLIMMDDAVKIQGKDEETQVVDLAQFIAEGL